MAEALEVLDALHAAETHAEHARRAYLDAPTAEAWSTFARAGVAQLEARRHAEDVLGLALVRLDVPTRVVTEVAS